MPAYAFPPSHVCSAPLCHLIPLCVVWRVIGIRNPLVVYISPAPCYFCHIYLCVPHDILFSHTLILQREWNRPLSTQDVLLVSRILFLSKAMRRIQSQRHSSNPISVLPKVHTLQICKHFFFFIDRVFSCSEQRSNANFAKYLFFLLLF